MDKYTENASTITTMFSDLDAIPAPIAAPAINQAVTAQQYLNDIFGELPAGEVAAIVPRKGLGWKASASILGRVATVGDERYTIVSSINPDQDGRLRTRREDCVKQYVVGLDDFGSAANSKTPMSAIAVPPSAIIETSPGNHQVAYFLDKPVSDQEEYEDSVLGLIHASGSDKGAIGCYRKIRIPGSIHHTGFRSRVVEYHPGLRYSLQELLDGYDAQPIKAQAIRRQVAPGAALDMDNHPDPVMRYFIDNDMVLCSASREGDYGIVCPSGGHDQGGETSTTYSPLHEGVTADDKMRRLLHCSHETCQEKHGNGALHTIKQLTAIQAAKGPAADREDPVAYLTRRYALDINSVGAIDIVDQVKGWGAYTKEEFHAKYAHVVVDGGGDKLVPATKVWWHSRDTMRIRGTMFRPELEAEFFMEHGERFLNSYRAPDFPETTATPQYLTHLNYLVPCDREREYILDWLAHKVQNPALRHPAIVWIADQAQGTGRGITVPLLSRLFKYQQSLQWDVFSGNSSQSKYDDWRGSNLLLVVNEAADLGASYATRAGAYETIKERVEPAIEYGVELAPKYGKKFIANIYHDTFIFSNHAKPFTIPNGDRRITAVTCNTQPPGDDYFKPMAKALASEAEAEAMYWWLMRRDVRGFDYTRPIMTPAKEIMQELSESLADRVHQVVMDKLEGDIVTRQQWHQLTNAAARELLGHTGGNDKKVADVVHVLDNTWTAAATLRPKDRKWQIRINDIRERPRVMRNIDKWQNKRSRKDLIWIKKEIAKNDGPVTQLSQENEW